MAWWSIPILATTAGAIWVRYAGAGTARIPGPPEPGSAQDRADLARFAAALREPMPGRADDVPGRR